MAGPDLLHLLDDVIGFEVSLFDAVDRALRAETPLVLVALHPLRVVAATPACRVQDIVDEIGISVGGASKSVDRLERSGWVRRVPHPDDRRGSAIELTAEGAWALAQGNAVAERVLRGRVADRLPARELASFAATLRTLRSDPDAT